MHSQFKSTAFFVVFFLLVFPLSLFSEQKGKPIFGRLDITKYVRTASHHGAGFQLIQAPLGNRNEIFETPFLWVHRCKIFPRSGIGLNMKRFMEGIYWALNIPAEFTVNGHTALLPAGANVLCRAGNYHGIFNPSYTDTLEFLHSAVEMKKFTNFESLGVFDLMDSLTTQKLESPAPFPWAILDQTLLRPAEKFHGGKGTILMRRLWDPDSFLTNWHSVDHVIIPSGSSIGLHKYINVEAVYYILKGSGKVTVNGYTWEIMPDDAIPCTIRDSIGIYNNSDKNLELFIMTLSMKKGEEPNYTDLGEDLTKR